MNASTTPTLSLVGNDSQHVVFTEVSSGKAKVCGLKGGVHLLKYFLENLRDPEQVPDPGKAMQIELQSPHWSIELSKKKRKKEGKNDEIEEFFRVDRHLHIRDPSLMKIEREGNSVKRTGVLLLEDSVHERDLSTKEVLDIYSLVNDIQVNERLVCKISRPLSKYRVDPLELLATKLVDSDGLKKILKESLLLKDTTVEALNNGSITYPTTVMKVLGTAGLETITDDAGWEWLKKLRELCTYSIGQSVKQSLQGKQATADDENLFKAILRARNGQETGLPSDFITSSGVTVENYTTDEDLQRLLEGKAVGDSKDLSAALEEILPDIEELVYLKEAKYTSLLDVLMDKQKTVKFQPIIIVDAQDLRKEGVQLSYRLSWSKTVEEFKQFLSGDSLFAKNLRNLEQNDEAPHLIVRFGCDGVIHCKTNKRNELSLYYANSKFVEGDYVQHRGTQMIGEATAFTAGLVHNLAGDANLNMKTAISYGMKAACWLVDQGFQLDKDAGFIYPTISPRTDPSGAPENYPERFSANEPWTIKTEDISKVETGRWSILTSGDLSRSMLDLAKDIVQNGTEEALQHKPTAQFGGLVTVDREEMENFRGIANLVQDYMKTPQTKPLSIGVFGFPGSGKSFGVGEVIKAVASGQGKDIHKLEFNLSQFLEYSDLLAAFQSIRDQTFSNKVPVVMFDEFDCSFGGKALGWLQYFLAPMQDGKFLERGHLRPLGSAIFIFVGGTSPTFAEFQATARKPAAVAAKKPDFVSRLRGSVDIWGPNKLSSRDDGDKTYTVRRAIILRSLLKRNKYLDQKGEFKVADNVLNALLCVSGFHHGTRSLEAIIKMSKITPGQEFTAAGFPSNDRLALYVDPIEFGEWHNNWHIDNESKRKAIEAKLCEYNDNRDTVNEWEPSNYEIILLSKPVAKNISIFLDSGKAINLTQCQTAEAVGQETVASRAENLLSRLNNSEANRTEQERSEERKIQQIAKGVYDQLKTIRCNKRTAAETIMPWWFVEKQDKRSNRYFGIAVTVWITLTPN